MIGRILLVPMLLIAGGFFCVIAALYAFAASMWLGIAVFLVTIVLLTALSKWEYQRVKRDLPPPDDRERVDPRTR
jgi:membrane protein implicated in regulation of membrane protease activity